MTARFNELQADAAASGELLAAGDTETITAAAPLSKNQQKKLKRQQA
jgi:hypothetical protein